MKRNNSSSGDSQYSNNKWKSSGCEIEEEEEEEEEEVVESSRELFEINSGVSLPTIKEEMEGSLFSFDFHNDGEDAVYVAVGKTDSSMDALLWTLNHAQRHSNTPPPLVFLIHVFPELRFIPTPLGKIPISQINPEQKEIHMIQERTKRREFLQKFLDVCSASKVNVDTILIESDMEAKALLDLIPILNIRKLALGTTKSSLRKLRSRRGSGIAHQVLQGAPEFCEVKIICEGKEVVIDSIMSESWSPRGSGDSPKAAPGAEESQSQGNDSFGCTCFKPKVIS